MRVRGKEGKVSYEMKSIIKLTDLNAAEIYDIFHIADGMPKGGHQNLLSAKSIVLFFPNTSIRTRVSFEKGIYLLGGQSILFPSETLDKKEELRDVCGYLNQWADMVIVRHRSMAVIEQLARFLTVPVINAMTDSNHPCEIISDMYALSKIRKDFTKDRYLFCGTAGNIGLTWKDASVVMGFELAQCCAAGHEISGIETYHNIREAVKGRDIICTDSLPSSVLPQFRECQVTKDIMAMANEGAVLNPCPPFYRGEEVSEDVIASDYFVGYSFKKYLLDVQQAIMAYCLTG